MDRDAAKNIISSHKLIRRKKSHEILKAISNNMPFDKICLPDNINIEQIKSLKSLYNEKKKEIETLYKTEIYPANLPFYLILQDKYPTFSWKLMGTEITQRSKHHNVNIVAPRIQNLNVSLLSLLVSNINIKADTLLHRRYSFLSKYPSDLIYSLEELFQNIQAIYPDYFNMEKIVGWLEKGLQGQPLVLFSPVCPDYSVEKVQEGSVSSYRYTFNELGTGVGLVAKHVLKILPYWRKFFEQNALDVKIIIGLGDIEAANESNLQRVNLTFEEFLTRLQKSKAAIQKASKTITQTTMITDLCGGFEAWNAYFQKFKLMFSQNDYGHSDLSLEKLLGIIKARKPLYDQWYGAKPSLEEYLPILLSQGAEYSSVGAVVAEKYTNCLILGADHSAMGPFYNVNQKIPTLYIKRPYL